MKKSGRYLILSVFSSKTLTRTYDALGRESALSIDAGYSLGYGYDTYGRYNALSMGTNTVTLGFTANSDLVGGIARSNGVNTAFTYEDERDLLTQVAHAPAPPADPMAVYGYTNDAIGRRTAMSKAGTAFVQADTISYGYNDRSEVVSAVSANLATYDYGYDFDPIGNRLTAASSDPSDPSDVSYASNSINQYTAITEDQNPPFNPTHDDDGNCTSAAFSTGTWTATWNCENRMVAIEKAGQKLEFAYDYMGRRVIKKVYAWDTDHWSLITDHRFVYNGYRLAQTLDALSDPANAIVQEFAWSLDDELRLVRDDEDIYFVHHDANRNVTELTDATGSLAAHYEYAPFGKLTAQTGAYAATNPFRFSSEYYDAETGLVYYNYRYYSPELGRWMSRDYVEYADELNIYTISCNNAIIYYDVYGNRKIRKPPLSGIGQPYVIDSEIPGIRHGRGSSEGGRFASVDDFKKHIKEQTSKMNPTEKKSWIKGIGESLSKKTNPYAPTAVDGWQAIITVTDALDGFASSTWCSSALKEFKCLNCQEAMEQAENCIGAVQDAIGGSIGTNPGLAIWKGLGQFFLDLKDKCDAAKAAKNQDECK